MVDMCDGTRLGPQHLLPIEICCVPSHALAKQHARLSLRQEESCEFLTAPQCSRRAVVSIDHKPSASVWKGNHEARSESFWKMRDMLLHDVGAFKPLGQCRWIHAMKHCGSDHLPSDSDIEAQREELIGLAVLPVVTGDWAA